MLVNFVQIILVIFWKFTNIISNKKVNTNSRLYMIGSKNVPVQTGLTHKGVVTFVLE